MKRLYLLLGWVWVTACSQPAPKETASPPAFRALGQTVTVETARSDESIGFEARQRIDLAGPADLAGVIIEVNDGVVTLLGSAPNRPAAWRAEAVARAVPGVKTVINEIQLTTPGTKF